MQKPAQKTRRGPRQARRGEQWLSVAAFVAETGFSERSVRRWIADHVLPCERFGPNLRNIRIPASALKSRSAA